MKTLLHLFFAAILLATIRNVSGYNFFRFLGNNFNNIHNEIPSYEIVYLPIIMPTQEAFNGSNMDDAFSFSFQAFGKTINLQLRENKKILSRDFKTFVLEDDILSEMEPPTSNCNFLHDDGLTIGAISNCIPGTIHGVLFENSSTFEILPLTSTIQEQLKIPQPLLAAASSNDQIPHVIQRRYLDKTHVEHGAIFENDYTDNHFYEKRSISRVTKAASNRPVGALTIELALFFDAAAYKIFSPYMNGKDSDLQHMLLAYMNGVQALYHHPSLGTTMELVLVRMDIMKTQPTKMPHYDGERSKLLDSFCEYQNGLNLPDDNDPGHWDMALYVSGLDFFAYENGKKSGVTMGLATVGGVCLGQYACVIAELGSTNIFGKPYPSAGFTSIYILAHEIGHNLGMHHDGSGNSCSKDGFIMSPSRGTNGETQWSSCSADVIEKLSWAKCLRDTGLPASGMDHSMFLDAPGQIYSVKRQCEILLRDRDAVMSPNQQIDTICYNLHCKTPHRSGYYFAGPALEGTECGSNLYCFGGECVDRIPQKPSQVIPGGWTKWKTGSCTSGCLLRSRGYQDKSRTCTNPVPINTDRGCEGSSYEKGLCDDTKVCRKKHRGSVETHASDRCRKFAEILPQLDPKGFGLQAPHEDARLWMGCAIFCRRVDSNSYYTPRIELNDLGISPYFPDGTLCHHDQTGNFYCLQHHCLPENFEFTKTSSFLHGLGEDIPYPHNAHPKTIIPPILRKYLSLGADGKPLQNTIKPGDMGLPKEEDWEITDYIELPTHNELN